MVHEGTEILGHSWWCLQKHWNYLTWSGRAWTWWVYVRAAEDLCPKGFAEKAGCTYITSTMWEVERRFFVHSCPTGQLGSGEENYWSLLTCVLVNAAKRFDCVVEILRARVLRDPPYLCYTLHRKEENTHFQECPCLCHWVLWKGRLQYSSVWMLDNRGIPNQWRWATSMMSHSGSEIKHSILTPRVSVSLGITS